MSMATAEAPDRYDDVQSMDLYGVYGGQVVSEEITYFFSSTDAELRRLDNSSE